MSGYGLKRASRAVAAEVVTRALQSDDSEAYFALRQRIIDLNEHRNFADSYERELQLKTPEERRAWCEETREHCIIGSFVNGELVGAMMITMQWPQLPQVCEWEATWVDPRYRGTGVAKASYEEVWNWTMAQGYKYAAVFIRDDNGRSRHIRQEQGFMRLATIHGERWADGSVANSELFIRDLHAQRQPGVDDPAVQAVRRVMLIGKPERQLSFA